MTDNNIVDVCYQKAVHLLKENRHLEGFLASSATAHYAAIWSRDACITSIGANLTEDGNLHETSRNTLTTLARLQAAMGQIPAVYWPHQRYWDWGEAGCTDASAWFVIAAWHYYKTTGDTMFLKALYPSLQKTISWLRSQDANNFGLIDSPEAGDWMDSTLNRCGKVMYVNALYYWAVLAFDELGQALGDDANHLSVDDIKFKFNLLFWPTLNSNYSDLLRHVEYDSGQQSLYPHPCSIAAFRDAVHKRRFYLSHVTYGRFADCCDILGNSLAILTGLADRQRRDTMLTYFKEKTVSYPYPAKCLAEPVTKSQDRWGILKHDVERFQSAEWRNPPFCYHNGAVWPFIGGFYILAILKGDQTELAKTELTRLAQANRLGIKSEWEFREWINSETAEPSGAAYQSWSAATYIMAYKAVVQDHTIHVVTGDR